MPCHCELGVNEVAIDCDLESAPLGTSVNVRGDVNLVPKFIGEKGD